jgi:hypothetical protein
MIKLEQTSEEQVIYRPSNKTCQFEPYFCLFQEVAELSHIKKLDDVEIGIERQELILVEDIKEELVTNLDL